MYDWGVNGLIRAFLLKFSTVSENEVFSFQTLKMSLK